MDKQGAKNESAFVDLLNQEMKELQTEELRVELGNIQTYAIMDIYPCAQKQPNRIVAEHLIQKGYRKVQENVVVFPREEYEKLQEKIRVLEVQLDLERTRTLEEWLALKEKQTAKKFAEMAKERKIEMGTDGHSYCMVFEDDIDEITKQFMEGKA